MPRFDLSQWWFSMFGLPSTQNGDIATWNRKAADYMQRVYSDVSHSKQTRTRFRLSLIWCLAAYAILVQTSWQAWDNLPVQPNLWLFFTFLGALVLDAALIFLVVRHRRKQDGSAWLGNNSKTYLKKHFQRTDVQQIQAVFEKAGSPELPFWWIQNSSGAMLRGVGKILIIGAPALFAFAVGIATLTQYRVSFGALPTLAFNGFEFLLLWLIPLLSLQSAATWSGFTDDAPSFALGVLYRDIRVLTRTDWR